MGEKILDSAAVAKHVGLTLNTVHTYHSRGSMPPADLYLGDNPGWYESTIRKWIKEREAYARNTQAERVSRRERYKKG